MEGTTDPSTADPALATSTTQSTFSFPTQASSTVDSLNTARKKHEDRAKRFGVEFVEPKLEVVNVNAPKRYLNPRHTGFVTGFSLDDEAEKQKRNLRAKRFAGEAEPAAADTKEESTADGMDSGMDVDLREERKDVGIDVQRRLDTIYLYGTDDMSTQDIFSYFKDYGPACVEWINDSSCNVIFLDVHTTMRALQGLSKPLDDFNLHVTKESGLLSVNPSQPQPTPTPTDPTNPSADQPPTSEPPSTDQQTTTPVQATPEQITLYGWRKGSPVKGVPILMRYATVLDVKSNEFKPSAYYKKMLGQLREKKQKKHLNTNKRHNKHRNRNRNRNRDRDDKDETGDSTTRGKRKLGDGDIDMTDPAEQEKRLQRRKKFFPEESVEPNNATNYIVSSTTVPALLQSGVSSVPSTNTSTDTPA